MSRLPALSLLFITSTALGQAHVDTVVKRADKPLHAGVATLTQDLRIGVADGDDNYMFGDVADIAVASNGAIYVFDRSVPTIRMYDAAGKYVKSIGHQGKGPGEYQPGSAIAVARDGKVLMWEPASMRINVYSATGDVLTDWPTGGNAMTSSGRNLMVVDTSGQISIRRSLFDRATFKARQVWVRFSSSGQLRDTVAAPTFTRTPSLLTAARNGASMSATVPFTANQLVVWSPAGYFVTADPDHYAFEMHASPTRIVSVRRNMPPRTVSAAERDSARHDVETRMSGVVPGWSWNGPDIPKVRAAFDRMDVRADGQIWILAERVPLKLKPGETAPTPAVMGGLSAGGPGPGTSGGSHCPTNGADVYDVFDASGTYLGQVKMPERMEIDEVRGDVVWGGFCDEDDVPSVRRYKISWK